MNVVTFGEIMLRLKSPGQERLFQSPRLEATFGGSEANVAVALARMGLPASFATVLPTIKSAGMREGVALSRRRRFAHKIQAGTDGITFSKTGPTRGRPTSSTTGPARRSPK